MLWGIWKARNDWVFNGTFIPPNRIAEKAKHLTIEAANLLMKEKVIRGLNTQWIGRRHPQQGNMKLNTDGSKNKMSGMAVADGVTGVFRDQ